MLNIVADYARGVAWKLDVDYPGLCGPIERLSEPQTHCWAVTIGTTASFISGDTSLESGVHAWRVQLQGLEAGPVFYGVGVIKAGEAVGDQLSTNNTSGSLCG